MLISQNGLCFHAFAATASKQPLQPYEYTPGPLGDEQVEIAVETCGICHSDLSMLDNDWGMSTYPLVLGHEVVGRVVAAGVADRVALTPPAPTPLDVSALIASIERLLADKYGAEDRRRFIAMEGGFSPAIWQEYADLGLLALVLLVLLRTDLISSWRKATPPDAPNQIGRAHV